MAKQMNKRLLILVLSILLLPLLASAQSFSEMEAAKAMAKSYGYSESEIEALINNASKSTARTETNAELETSVTQDSPLLVKQAKKDEEEKEDDTHKIYGHDFFSSKALSIIPSINAPAPSSYILGAGDDISIDVWGNTTAKISSVIGRDGTVLVNGVGPVRSTATSEAAPTSGSASTAPAPSPSTWWATWSCPAPTRSRPSPRSALPCSWPAA